MEIKNSIIYLNNNKKGGLVIEKNRKSIRVNCVSSIGNLIIFLASLPHFVEKDFNNNKSSVILATYKYR